MKNKPIYLITLVMYILCTQAKAQSANVRLKDTFVKESLSEENLHAFESRAQQKIKDYANYIEIISDKKYDSRMRKEAAATALKLFLSADTKIKEPLNEEKTKTWKISDYLDALTACSYQRMISAISNLRLTKELQKEKDNTYRGEITFTQTMKAYNKKGEQILSKTSEKKVEIVLKKVKKQFGEKTEEVWEVLIGNII